MKKLALNTAGFPDAVDDMARYRKILETNFPQHRVASLPLGHRLRGLWNREDHLAASELLALAYGIENAEKVSIPWTKNHVQRILGRSKNEQIGSTFELNAAAMLLQGGCNIKCGVKNSPGYDLEMPISEEKTLFISLKNHDQSDIEAAFHDRCEKFRTIVLQKLEPGGKPAYIRIEAKELPNEDDWQAIERLLPVLPLENHLSTETCGQIDIQTMRLHPLNSNSFAQSPFSYLIVINSAGHNREQQNFSSNLEKAALNMKKNLANKKNAVKVVFMRVYATANLTHLEETASTLLNSTEVDYGIDGVILYQTAVIRENHTSVISHCLKVISSNRWDFEKSKLKVCPYVGVQIVHPSKLVLQYNGQTMSEETQEYFFQRGDYYHEWVFQEGTNDIVNPAPGIHTHLVMQGQPFSGKIFPEQDKLFLI